jgi:hypothetical protein
LQRSARSGGRLDIQHVSARPLNLIVMPLANIEDDDKTS